MESRSSQSPDDDNDDNDNDAKQTIKNIFIVMVEREYVD